ncbi:hypothetical protein APHNP_0167 [Anaplasma phagocytophilum str. ApNP]|uniref:Uncharacterized protein n=1 Tax=Anaplasma phagocytophilum str. ApNP TaxID=1359153 RepID=A0A0F3NJ31_ANAPH|nr:hypothetical protein APHNP_0167 [Anaplasma phagocytophilum str. ApNP]
MIRASWYVFDSCEGQLEEYLRFAACMVRYSNLCASLFMAQKLSYLE